MKDEFDIGSKGSKESKERVETTYQEMMRDGGVQVIAKLMQMDVINQLSVVSVVLGKLVFDIHEGMARKELGLDRNKDKDKVAFKESFDKTTKILNELEVIVNDYSKENGLEENHLDFVAMLFSSMMEAVADKSSVGFFTADDILRLAKEEHPNANVTMTTVTCDTCEKDFEALNVDKEQVIICPICQAGGHKED